MRKTKIVPTKFRLWFRCSPFEITLGTGGLTNAWVRKPFFRKLDFLFQLEYHSECEKYPPFSRCLHARRACALQARCEFNLSCQECHTSNVSVSFIFLLFCSFRSFRLFRSFRFGSFVSLFRVLVHVLQKAASPQQGRKNKWHHRKARAYETV